MKRFAPWLACSCLTIASAQDTELDLRTLTLMARAHAVVVCNCHVLMKRTIAQCDADPFYFFSEDIARRTDVRVLGDDGEERVIVESADGSIRAEAVHESDPGGEYGCAVR